MGYDGKTLLMVWEREIYRSDTGSIEEVIQNLKEEEEEEEEEEEDRKMEERKGNRMEIK